MIIVGIDKLSRPKAISRSAAAQEKAQSAVKNVSVYQLRACPFCVKTRRAIHQLNVDIELRDIGKHQEHRATLEKEGGRVMVPCLRIEEESGVRWMYESSDIISYLQQTVASSTAG